MKSYFEDYIIKPLKVDSLLKNSNLDFLNYQILSNENLIYNIGVKQAHHAIKKFKIENWDLFEENEIDFTEADFKKIFLNDFPENEFILLFTHEGIIIKNCAFAFEPKNFLKFSNEYENFFSMEFFQLSYYCILATKAKICRFLDSDGYVHEIKF